MDKLDRGCNRARDLGDRIMARRMAGATAPFRTDNRCRSQDIARATPTVIRRTLDWPVLYLVATSSDPTYCLCPYRNLDVRCTALFPRSGTVLMGSPDIGGDVQSFKRLRSAVECRAPPSHSRAFRLGTSSFISGTPGRRSWGGVALSELDICVCYSELLGFSHPSWT